MSVSLQGCPLQLKDRPHAAAHVELQNSDLGQSSTSTPRSTAAVARVKLFQELVKAVYLASLNLSATELAPHMAHINTLASRWPSQLAAVAARLEEHRRAAGFSHLLTAAEMHQLFLLAQRQAASHLAAKTPRAQQALVLRRIALAASCPAVQPSSAAQQCSLPAAPSTG